MERAKKALWVDEDTHQRVKILSAQRRLTVEELIREIVAESATKGEIRGQ